MTESPVSPRGCCDPASLAFVICHARGGFRIQAYLTEETSLTRQALMSQLPYATTTSPNPSLTSKTKTAWW